MARPEKVAVVEDVRARLEESTAAVLTEYRGLSVGDLADLRAELRKNGAEYKVAKNTLVRIAAKDAGLDIPDDLLTGPTAVTFVKDDPVAVAKVLRSFSKDHPALVVKGSVLDGKLLDAGDTMKLADLASREELLAKLAGLFEAVVAQPARLALANLTKAARLLAALQAKREEAGETMDAPAPAAADTASPEAAAAPEGDSEPSPPADEQAGVVDETPEPDSPAAEAVTAEAEADPDVNATPADAEPVSKQGASETENP